MKNRTLLVGAGLLALYAVAHTIQINKPVAATTPIEVSVTASSTNIAWYSPRWGKCVPVLGIDPDPAISPASLRQTAIANGDIVGPMQTVPGGFKFQANDRTLIFFPKWTCENFLNFMNRSN